ncbi:hypothetical protein IQ26_06865 [Mesorhizobium tianshanense]|uniref:Uncharacterized protein n=1 Tax=Mesorhizobium tianshanense TaxID=39844 RepID=A0A562MNI2_9HYPH|nr:hypothetical protein IQ26_06865 [Mesorhizobium tianshanense]
MAKALFKSISQNLADTPHRQSLRRHFIPSPGQPKRRNISPAEHHAHTPLQGAASFRNQGRLVLGTRGRDHFGIGGRHPSEFAVRQQGDGLAPLKVTDDRPIALISSPRQSSMPITVGGTKRGLPRRRTMRSNVSLLTGSINPLCEAGRGPAAQRKPKVMDDLVEPGGSPRPRRQNISVETLGEDPPAAQHCAAVERPSHDPNRLVRHRQVRQAPPIPTVDPLRPRSAARTEARRTRGKNRDQHHLTVNGGVVHHKAARDEGRRPQCIAYDCLCETKASRHPISIKSESDGVV